MVLAGDGWTCKGSTAYFRARAGATAGAYDRSDEDFRVAVAEYRRLGTDGLLAKALEAWGYSLRGRDDVRAQACLDESALLTGRFPLALGAGDFEAVVADEADAVLTAAG
jgi:hypothetical protein